MHQIRLIEKWNLSPEKFEDIFWHKAGKGLKRSFIICNSYSRSAKEPNRFRVMFLYKKPARSIGEHKAVLNSIVSRLESEGFSEKDMSLDRQCKTGVQSFYFLARTGHILIMPSSGLTALRRGTSTTESTAAPIGGPPNPRRQDREADRCR